MSVALVIPIHPKHYNFIYNLIDLITINIDIFLIFSNDEHYNQFEKKNKIKKIIAPNILNEQIIITYKKFFALEQLKNENYDYFIVCDAEITIISKNFNITNILNKINNIFNNKIIYAGETISNTPINNTMACAITECSCTLLKDSDKLKEITNNYTLYYWWSDLPVYKKEHLDHFFSLINYKNNNNFSWYHFDNTIYLSYLLLHHNFTIINITPLLNYNWSLECYNTNNINNLQLLKTNNYGSSFIYYQLYMNNIEYFNKEGTFLIFHLDR